MIPMPVRNGLVVHQVKPKVSCKSSPGLIQL